MDLLKTIMLYFTMVFIASVQSSPDPSQMPRATETPQQTRTAVVSTTVAATQTITGTPTPTATATIKPTAVPTPDITPNNDYKTVKVGDKGEKVTTMQRRLAELGYYTGEIDGAFGNQTRRAVERFQYYQGLSVDGIAGKRTLTVLYESKDVVLSPEETTPSPSISATDTATQQAAADTPAPTFVPAVTTAPTSVPTASEAITSETPASTQSPAPTEQSATETPEVVASSTPSVVEATVLENFGFVLGGQTTPLTLQAEQLATATDEPAVLRPLQAGETVYVPYLEILKDAGTVLIPGVDAAREEVAFTMLSDIFQITYVSDAEGRMTTLTLTKNQVPQPLTLNDALLVDGVFYLNMTIATDLTGITFTLDETTKLYKVVLPSLPVA